MYEQNDLSYVDYCKTHTDISVGLTYSQTKQYEKYLNTMVRQKLTKVGALIDGSVEFKEVTGEWFSGLSNARVVTNLGVTGIRNTSNWFPTKSDTVTAVITSTFGDLQYISYLVQEKCVKEWEDTYTPNKNEVYSSGYTSKDFELCKGFYMNNLPIPTMLLGEYKKAWDYAFKDIRLKKFYSLAGYDYHQFLDTQVKLLELVNKQVVAGTVPVNDTELADLVALFNKALLRVTTLGFTPDTLVDYPRHVIYKTAGKNGLRLATLGEMGSLPPQTYRVEEVLLGKNEYEMLLVFCWFCTGNERVIKLLNRFSDNTLSKLSATNTRTIMKLVLDYLSSERLITDLSSVEEKLQETRYPDTAPDEIIDVPFIDKCREVYQARKEFLSRGTKKGNRNTATSYEGILASIANQYINGRKLTDKQITLINNDYTSLKNGDKRTNLYTPEVENKINEVRNWFNYDRRAVPNEIMGTVLKYKRCSEKQLAVINSEYEKYQEEKASGIGANTGTGASAGTGTDTPQRSTQTPRPNTAQTPTNNTANNNAPFVPDFTSAPGIPSAPNITAPTKPAATEPVQAFSYSDYDWEEVDI